MKHILSLHKRAWLIGLLFTVILWSCVFAFSNLHFDVNDDQFILRSVTGNTSNTCFTFHAHVQSFITAPLILLGRLFPLIPWFSFMQIMLMMLSTVTIIKSIILCFSRKFSRYLFFISVCFALCCVLVYLYYPSVVLTYSTVAAVLCAAAVAHLMSINFEYASDKNLLLSSLYSLFLLVISYGLREMAALPGLAFCFIVFLYRYITVFGWGKHVKRSAKPMFIIFIIVVTTFTGLISARQAEISMSGQRDFMDWHQARMDVIDYIDLDQISPETLGTIGWTTNDAHLLKQWYTLDSQYETKDFEYIADVHSNAKLYAPPGIAVEQFRLHHPYIFSSILFLVPLGGICLLGALVSEQRRWAAAVLCADGIVCGGLLLYLAWVGRLLVRSAMTPLIPAAVLLFCLIPECLPTFQVTLTRCKKVGCLLIYVGLCLATLAYTAYYFVPTARSTRYIKPKWDYDTYASRDAVALQNPDLLFIYSGDIVNDLRVFPDFSKGIPSNLLTWGGWMAHTEEYNAKLAVFGIDGDQFSAQDWLHPSVRLLTIEQEPNAALITYLCEKLALPVQWERTQMDAALFAYRFYTE